MYKHAYLFLSTLLLLTTVALSQEVKYDVQAGKSTLNWEAYKITGKHRGLISIKNGYITATEEAFTGGTIFIDMTTIECLDIEDPEDNKKLVDHLKSDDFFGVQQHTMSVIKIYDVKPYKDNYEYNYILDAGVTIKGITNNVQFPAKFEQKNNKSFLTGVITIDRTLYGIRYGSGKFFENLGDQLIYDEFTINFKIVSTPPQEN